MGGVCSDPALTHNERILLSGQNFGTGYLTSYMPSTGYIPAGTTVTKTVTTTTPVVQNVVSSSGFNTGIGSYNTPDLVIPGAIGAAALGGVAVGGSNFLEKRYSEDRIGASNAVPIVVDEPYLTNQVVTNTYADHRLDLSDHKEVIRDIPVTESVVAPVVTTTSNYVAPVVTTTSNYVAPVASSTSSYVAPVVAGLGGLGAAAVGAATYETTTTTTNVNQNYVPPVSTVSYNNTFVNPPQTGMSVVNQQTFDPNLVPSRIDIYGNRMWRETPSTINVPTSVINSANGLKNNAAAALPSTIGLDIYGNARRPLPTIVGVPASGVQVPGSVGVNYH